MTDGPDLDDRLLDLSVAGRLQEFPRQSGTNSSVLRHSKKRPFDETCWLVHSAAEVSG